MNTIYAYLIKIPFLAILIFGLIIFFFHFVSPCGLSVFLVLFWSVILLIRISKFFGIDVLSRYVIIMVMLVNIIYSIYYAINRNIPEYGIKCIAYLDYIFYKERTATYDYHIRYFDNNNDLHHIIVNYHKKQNNEMDTYLIIVKGEDRRIIRNNLSAIDFEKYKYPVTCISDNIEVGNDSYEYAKYSPDIAYNSFGLTIVLKATTYDSKFISFYDLNHKFQYLAKERSDRDTFLVYSNINPNFSDGWHICPDSLCTPENISKVDSAGYGYLFRGKIYSAAETEKYWNIIEQYKLRKH